MIRPQRTNGSNRTTASVDTIFGGKGDDIINPLRVTFDDDGRPTSVGTSVIYATDTTVDETATLDGFASYGAPNAFWDGGEGDDIIFASEGSQYDSTYLGGNGDDKLYGT